MGMEGSYSGGMTPAEAILATDRNRCGDGLFGSGSNWILFLFFLMAWGRGGFGGWGGYGEVNSTGNFINNDFLYTNLKNTMDNGFTQVANQNFGIQKDLCQGFNGVMAGISENRFAAQQCCCETNRNIDAVRYENAKNTCEITSAIHAEGEATRALINANTMQDLRDRLEAKSQELQTANFQLSQQAQSANLIDQLRPCPVPAYPACSPYQSYGWGQFMNGCGNGCGC